MGTEVKIYSRSIYNALDFLGDVGGLFDALKLIGAGILSILGTGDGLAGRLISRLFFTAPRSNSQEDSNRQDQSQSRSFSHLDHTNIYRSD